MFPRIFAVICTLFVGAVLSGCSSESSPSMSSAEKTAFTDKSCSTDSFIIYFDDDDAEERINSFICSLNGDIIYDYKNLNAVAVHFPNELSSQNISSLSGIEGVLSVQRDCLMTPH